jgi:hypothetical protein
MRSLQKLSDGRESWGLKMVLIRPVRLAYQPAVLFSKNKPATSNQTALLFSQNKSASVTRHQPNEQADLE